MNTEWIHYFGYGSLVNRKTRPAREVAHAARLNGWRRVWNHRVADPNRNQPCTSLSIEPINSEPNLRGSLALSGTRQTVPEGIDGVIVRLPVCELPQLDAREAGYDRLGLPLDLFCFTDELMGELEQEGTRQIMVYRSQKQNRVMASERHPVLKSYIDCVLSGYLERFGSEGVQDMIASTRGWELPCLDDRADPYYPRSVPVTDTDQAYFDQSIGQSLLTMSQRRLA